MPKSGSKTKIISLKKKLNLKEWYIAKHPLNKNPSVENMQSNISLQKKSGKEGSIERLPKKKQAHT